MGTIVSLHAHPDDESIATGGTLAKASELGHRCVLVFATRGELGEPVEGVLGPDEQLALRRTAECYESAAALGVDRVEFLGYTDSGMMGESTNDAPWCFWQASVPSAARRLAAILDEESADVLTVYDDHGGYGHPDHIQVHRVGHEAARMAGTPAVLEATMNRDLVKRAIAMAADLLPAEDGGEAVDPPEMGDDFGTPEAEITHVVDSTSVIARKRSSMQSHASQIGPDHFMLSMPDEAFAFVFGPEHYLHRGSSDDGLDPMWAELFEPFSP